MASGPSTKRYEGNTAALPGLTPGIQGLLQNFLQSGQNPYAQPYQPSALQQQAGNTYSQGLQQPTSQQNAYSQFAGQLPQMMGQLQQGYGGIMNANSAQGITDAAQPIFQRNMQLGADTLRQAGPRFNSNTERLVADQGTKSMQDFNLFAQQARQAGQQNQLGALAGLSNGMNQGYGTLGQLAGGADSSYMNMLNGAGNFANQMQGQNLQSQGMNQQMLQQLLGMAGGYGVGQPIFSQDPGWWSQAMQGLSTIGGLGMSYAGMQGGGGGGGGSYAGEGALTGGGQPYSNPGGGSTYGPGGALNPTAPIGAGGVQYNPGGPNPNATNRTFDPRVWQWGMR